MLAKVIVTVLVMVGVSAFVWSTDRITFQGERTVYTVTCERDMWEGSRCASKLGAGARYTFRASRSRQEVLYWVVGSKTPSGKYANCQVENRGNWTCMVGTEQPRTITVEMKDDRPTHVGDGVTPQLRAVPKWKWWAIFYGVGRFTKTSA
jgi:hypothetical protein